MLTTATQRKTNCLAVVETVDFQNNSYACPYVGRKRWIDLETSLGRATEIVRVPVDRQADSVILATTHMGIGRRLFGLSAGLLPQQTDVPVLVVPLTGSETLGAKYEFDIEKSKIPPSP